MRSITFMNTQLRGGGLRLQGVLIRSITFMNTYFFSVVSSFWMKIMLTYSLFCIYKVQIQTR